jgi:hypothetical protein
MLCKYCHLKTHFIDKCPTIICKNCKEIGHPQWLCKDKKNNKNEKNNINKNIIEKKYNFTDEIKKKVVIESNIQKNISYFLKIEKQNWGDLIQL